VNEQAHQQSVDPDGPQDKNAILQRPRAYKAIVSEALDEPARRAIGLPTADDEPLPVVIELNVYHHQGLDGAIRQLREEWQSVISRIEPPEQIANTYCPANLTMLEVRALVNQDLEQDPTRRAVYRVWPDFPIHPLIDRSCSTVKVDAARRSYGASGRNIVWAVVDSGIDENHPHFERYETLAGGVERLHRDFTDPQNPQPRSALTDGFGHGTHVAGIIAGALRPETGFRVTQQFQNPDPRSGTKVDERKIKDPTVLAGMAPETKLVSLKVLDADGRGSSMNVVRALDYIRTQINGEKLMRVHGVNLSLGYEFDPKWFACGQSPICVEVNRLVRSGVVVVIAAGNTGYGTLGTFQRQSNVGLTMTINDPGNAEMAITVGATHRDMPHVYGVSYFSSKGPTGDGRLKPDLIAPGERVTSCGTGKYLDALGDIVPIGQPVIPGGAVYVEDSGTSVAAPHVSGAIAGFLSIRGEYIGQPEQIKQIFTSSATSLGRERYFQGSGLVDVIRAIQSV
jgi:subtilisin family serine protease